MEYSWENIKWIKNIKRNNGEDWAYANVFNQTTFLLNWPTGKKGSAYTPQIGDIILLFQKVNYIEGQKNYNVLMTHLVSPISNDVIPDLQSINHKWAREVKLIAMANPLHSIPNPGYYDFFKPNRGLTNPIRNLEDNKGFNENDLKKDIWNLFSNYLCEVPNLQSAPVYDEIGAEEGAKVLINHIQKEVALRDSQIVKEAKRRAKEKNNGIIPCECCQFDFYVTYGNLGKDFIECHHKKAISEGTRITFISDLAMVCPNCHRMLHRRKDNGEYHSIESLKELINQNRILFI